MIYLLAVFAIVLALGGGRGLVPLILLGGMAYMLWG